MIIIITLLADSQEFITIKRERGIPNISPTELIIINTIVIIPLILRVKKRKKTRIIARRVIFTKEFSFNQLKKIIRKILKETTTRDT